MHIVFFCGVPLWLGMILWTIGTALRRDAKTITFVKASPSSLPIVHHTSLHQAGGISAQAQQSDVIKCKWCAPTVVLIVLLALVLGTVSFIQRSAPDYVADAEWQRIREKYPPEPVGFSTRSPSPVAVTPPEKASPRAVPEPNTNDSLPRITLITGANIRQAPSTSAAILRAGHQGESLSQFGATNSWVQVGADKPEGWVSRQLVRSRAR